MWFFGTIGICILISNAIMTIIMINGGKSLINTIWALFCTCVSILWVSLYYISMATSSIEALMWWKIAYLWVTNLPVLMLHTTMLIVENKSKIMKYTLVTSYIITCIFYLLNLYGILIPNVSFIFGEMYFNTPYSVSFIFFFGFFTVLFGILFDLLIRAYKDTLRSDKDLILHFSLWLWVGLIGYGSLIFPVFNIYFYPYGAVFIAIYPLIVWFAILNHHLFNAKYAFLQLLRVIFISLLSAWGIWGIVWALWYFFAYTYEINFLEVIISSTFIGCFILFYKNKTLGEIFLLESMRDMKRETSKFLERTSTFPDQESLLMALEEYFWKWIRIRHVKIFREKNKNTYPYTIEYFQKNTYPLIRGSISKNPSRMSTSERRDLIEEVDKIGTIIFPIENIDKTEMLLLVLGSKESEKTFSGEEIETIQHILPKIALSLQVLEFNRSLKNEVKVQTTVLAKKNKEIEKAYEKLKEIDQNKDNFLAIASHELRTPMTIIKGYADLFLKDTLWPLNVNEKQYMKKIYDSTESLINMVNNILDISKIEAWRMKLNISTINIHNLIEKCINDFESMFSEKNIALTLNDTSTLQMIDTDDEKFRLIMNNLLSNACKFTLSWWKVDITLSEKWSSLLIRVCDTGIGISEKQVEHIFEKFSESNNNNYTKKSIRGTGLWLNLSKQLIEMLWGKIRVSSKEWSWSCFEFSLPI